MNDTIEMLKRKVAAGTAAIEALTTINQPKQFSSPAERQEFKAVESRADAVFAEFGKTTAQLMEPRVTETPFQYRRRVLQRIAAETKQYRNRDFSSVPPSDFLSIEKTVYDDAKIQSKHPLDLAPNEFREIKKTIGGREVIDFVCGGDGIGAKKVLYAPFIAAPHGNAIGPGLGSDDKTVVPIPFVPGR